MVNGKIRYVTRVLGLAPLTYFLMVFNSYAYVTSLDDAMPGFASSENPFFGNVLDSAITDKTWQKVDDNLYLGPTGQSYQYNSETGEITQSTTSTVGNSTYSADGKLLIRKKEVFKDGELTGYNTFYYQSYDENGKLTEYDRVRTDTSNNIVKINSYRDRTFNDDGKIESYELQTKDKDGNVESTKLYSDIAYYDTTGKQSGYIRDDYNSEGALVKNHVYGKNEDGKVISYNRSIYDPITGVETQTYSRSNYDYDARTYDWVKTDSDGNTTTGTNSF